MLRAGIPMREIDRTDLKMYLRVMAHAAQREEKEEEQGQETRDKGQGKKPVIELKRGYIDDFF